MNATVDAAGQVPDEEGVDVAEEQVAGFGCGARAGHMVENPAELEAAEIGGQRQAGAGAIAVLPAVGAELGNGVGDARVLPDDGVVDGLAGFAVPDYGGFALVGDADGGEVRGPQVRARPSPR